MFHGYSDRGSMQEIWFTNVFNTLCGTMTPDYIFIFVDNSGSLRTYNLDPGFSSFVSWLQSTYPNAIIPDEPSYLYEPDDERWLKWMNDALTSVFVNEN